MPSKFHDEALRQTATHRRDDVRAEFGGMVPGCCPPNTCSSPGVVSECVCPPRPSRSREILMGWLVNGCDCLHSNGLQDDCRRTGCHGNAYCLLPEPHCFPSSLRPAHEACRQPRKPYCHCFPW
ncbi:uncharacterized protein LOC126267266 [Schistocerca gregaria]|uniref:uncharacterized protein LOC126267266 n=1 Tax=Schistocerca gregaria TaxID=7010 RepID=UPI00211EBB5F|nr:uncharacterized protein LOC126267266 [Schistocerca gregaria]